jgi:hypothetical protein
MSAKPDETDLETCSRCARSARDPDDRSTWVTIDDEEVCPGCLTLLETDRLAGGR